MKTKIIYISGGDVFAPSDVRDAFEEVRKMLNLAPDTVIFGVPVDADDIGAGRGAPMVMATSPMPASVAVPTAENNSDVNVPASEKPKRGRKNKTMDAVPESVAIVDAPVSDPVADAPDDAAPTPILSVLGIMKPTADDTPESDNGEDIVDIMDDEDPAEIPPTLDAEPVVPQISISRKIEETCDDAGCVQKTTTEMTRTITRTAPDGRAPTIEDIFAELEPLKEEKIVDLGNRSDDDCADADDLETDATLTKMATEFAAAQDDIPDEPLSKPGKIGKLKNILPFKKAKKEESSLLGDLFGWAGIAANDEDEKFTVPSWALGNN